MSNSSYLVYHRSFFIVSFTFRLEVVRSLYLGNTVSVMFVTDFNVCVCRKRTCYIEQKSTLLQYELQNLTGGVSHMLYSL